MEEMILFKNNKKTQNRKRAWPRRADLGFESGGKGCMVKSGVGDIDVNNCFSFLTSQSYFKAQMLSIQ